MVGGAFKKNFLSYSFHIFFAQKNSLFSLGPLSHCAHLFLVLFFPRVFIIFCHQNLKKPLKMEIKIGSGCVKNTQFQNLKSSFLLGSMPTGRLSLSLLTLCLRSFLFTSVLCYAISPHLKNYFIISWQCVDNAKIFSKLVPVTFSGQIYACLEKLSPRQFVPWVSYRPSLTQPNLT